MDLLFDNRLWKINLFLLLAFLIETSCTGCFSDLKEMCCIDSARDEITSLPKNTNCTGLAFYSNGHTGMPTINALKSKQKNVFVLNDYNYTNYIDKLHPHNLDGFLKDLVYQIDNYDIDILIFEGLVKFDDPGYDNLFQMNIRRLFLRLNDIRPNTLCGIFLRWSPDIGVNLQYLEKVVPFFVLRSFDNHRCYHKKNQADMDPIDPVGEIEDKVKGILPIMNGGKLCIGIRILVKSTKKKNSYAKHNDDESYSNFCVQRVNKDRRFCIETLSNFYKKIYIELPITVAAPNPIILRRLFTFIFIGKGRLVSKYKLAGAIIQSLDRDDYACKCGCGCYPVMTAIDAGIQGLPEPQVTNCSTWTLLKKDRH